MEIRELYEKIEEVIKEQWPEDYSTGQGGRINIGAFRQYLKDKGVDIHNLLQTKKEE